MSRKVKIFPIKDTIKPFSLLRKIFPWHFSISNEPFSWIMIEEEILYSIYVNKDKENMAMLDSPCPDKMPLIMSPLSPFKRCHSKVDQLRDP
jgi:hypothetical protein